jgi:ribonucleoside-diphosphate reductase beta chain
MPTLLDLTSQGDVGTMTDESKLGSVVLMDPQQLYELWERQNWQSQIIDFTKDKEDWQGLSEEDRKQVAWNLSSFFVGEERVTTQFTGLVAAYESQSEEAFVATQQVDEARHAQHFNRFYEQVVGYDGTFDDRLERARQDLNEAFLIMFDQHLVDACNRLLADPSDREAKVDFITTYHMVIEGTLGLTAFNFIVRYLEREALLPGFVEGYSKIHHDEQRHIAYGTWFLREALRATPALGENVRQTLRSLLPAVAQALAPPDREGTDWDALGAGSEEIRDFAVSGLSRRLKIVGVPLDSL